MHGNVTWDEYMAENLRDPEYAAAHEVGKPFTNLGLNVWSRRIEQGLTQAQLADAAKMKQPRIADIERDEANPTLLTISRIASALGVTASELLAEPDPRRLASARATFERAAPAATPAPAAASRPARRRKTA